MTQGTSAPGCLSERELYCMLICMLICMHTLMAEFPQHSHCAVSKCSMHAGETARQSGGTVREENCILPPGFSAVTSPLSTLMRASYVPSQGYGSQQDRWPSCPTDW